MGDRGVYTLTSWALPGSRDTTLSTNAHLEALQRNNFDKKFVGERSLWSLWSLLAFSSLDRGPSLSCMSLPFVAVVPSRGSKILNSQRVLRSVYSTVWMFPLIERTCMPHEGTTMDHRIPYFSILARAGKGIFFIYGYEVWNSNK